MTGLSQGIAQRVERPTEERQHVASWYTPGLSDPLGDRLLMFDNTTSSSLEMLRFKPEFAKAAGFEDALRRRVDQLMNFSHPSVAKVRTVELLGEDELALISNHTAGRRLSDVLNQAKGPQFATELVKQLMPALAALQEHGGGMAHGLLTPERVMVTPDGQLVLIEHAIGSAMDALKLPVERLRSEFGLVTLRVDSRVDDPRADVLQVGYLALSLLVGNRVVSLDSARAIVSGWSRHALGPGSDAPLYLRRWLGRALGIDSAPFTSANEAELGILEWPEGELGREDRPTKRIPADSPSNEPLTIGVSVAEAVEAVQPASTEPDGGLISGGQFLSELDSEVATTRSVERESPRPVRQSARTIPTLEHGRGTSVDDWPAEDPRRQSPVWRRWLVPSITALCVVEAGIIATLVASWPATISTGPVSTPPPASAQAGQTIVPSVPPAVQITDGHIDIASDPLGARVVIDDQPVGTTPLSTSLAPGAHTVVISNGTSSARRTVNIASDSTATLMVTLTPAGSTGGWLTVDTPLELQVFEGSSLLGTTKAARLMLPSGRRELRLSSSALDFETVIKVDIQAGETVTVPVTVPNGVISLNALPWANVSLNGQALGTTPIANLSIPIGAHEVIWRHPQLGDRRQTIVVTAKAPMRLVVDLRK